MSRHFFAIWSALILCTAWGASTFTYLDPGLTTTIMDWQVCFICQDSTAEPLKCPLNVQGVVGDKSEPYRIFVNNLKAFQELDSLPVVLNFGDDITVNELVQNKAKWHKSCYVKFSKEKLERATKKRKRECTSEDCTNSKKRPRLSFDKHACIFCQKSNGHLHEFQTLQAGQKILEMATDLQEMDLLTRLEGGDVVAIEARYHLGCLTVLRNRHRSLQRGKESQESCEVEQLKARALVELIAYIENCVECGTVFFKFSDLHQLYEKRLKDLGIAKEINRIRFKEKILKYFEYSQEQSDGKHKLLVFEKGLREMLRQKRQDYEDDASVIAKAAKILRKDMETFQGFKFDGTFRTGCQSESVPSTLKMLMSMLLFGTNLTEQSSSESQAMLTIAQTVFFNFKKGSLPSSSPRHSIDREPPLPLYLAMKIHTETRSKKMIKMLHGLGLSTSYDRIIEIENQLANAVCQDFQSKGTVVPVKMRKGLFTIGALDNIDHNPSSTTSKGSFHGTGISLFQFPSLSNSGQEQESLKISADDEKKHSLPASYTTVPDVEFKPANCTIPQLSATSTPTEGELERAKSEEQTWLEDACELLNKEEIDENDVIAWSAHHASKERSTSDVSPTINQLLPLFHEKSTTAAMIKHGMLMLQKATEYLNPRQVPVMTVDAPLYALAKQVQWTWPKTHGEDKFIVMLGGLHIEMAIWKTFGDYLKGSGWTNAITEAGVASSGTADSFLRASHLTRTRFAHQVTALALAKLQNNAFLETADLHESKKSWKKKMTERSPTFQYWDTVLNMQMLGLIFVRAHREGNFLLYIECLKALTPWFFTLDHQNYARWLPIHIRDMENLPASILEEFEENSHWVIQKTSNRFSAMPVDQAHEQNNKAVKDCGGAIGLTENPSAFRKWMISGPEQARLLEEFEEGYILEEMPEVTCHHEEGESTQKHFKESAANLVQTIAAMGNPFIHNSDELLAIDTRNVLDNSVVNTVRSAYEYGKEQFVKYQKDVIIDRTCSIYEPIKKNRFPLFTSSMKKTKKKQNVLVTSLKKEVSLFSRLYIAMQQRNSDMTTFFSHENHPFPPSMSDEGKLRLGQKSDLLCVLPGVTEEGGDKIVQHTPPASPDAVVFDGAAVVHFLPVTDKLTFDDYADRVFIPYIMRSLRKANRVDLVWDSYRPSSIKDGTRDKRGIGVRRKVEGKNRLPGDWSAFLRDPHNKVELFAFLANKICNMQLPEGKVAFTSGSTAVQGNDHMMAYSNCNHEEADTRLMIHLQDAVQNGCTNCLVRTVDTDIIVILVGKFHHLINLHNDVNIWVAFGTAKNFKYIHINSIYQHLGQEKSVALPVFHSFTGCDTTSAFHGKGKKSAWEAWQVFQEVTTAFVHIALNPFSPLNLDSEDFQLLEQFTIKLYDKRSTKRHINEVRQELFCQKGRTMGMLPPTQDALLQHSRRAAYQAGIWCTSEQIEQDAPSPENWGWTLSDGHSWVPVWSTLPVSSTACSVLVKCGCKSTNGCSGRCACKKASWNCTKLCSCKCKK